MTEQTNPEGDNPKRRETAFSKWHIREYRVLDLLAELLHWIEVLLAALSVAFVAIGIFYLLGELLHFRDGIDELSLHTSFEELLSDVLLLVVGIELALMLVRRTPESLIEVMYFVVARKMLIKADTFWDLILGVAALAGLFAIRKYLQYVPEQTRNLKRKKLKRKKKEEPVPAAD